MIWMVLSNREPGEPNDFLVRSYNNEAAASRHASEIGGRVEATELRIEGPFYSDYEEAPVVTHDLERKSADKVQQMERPRFSEWEDVEWDDVIDYVKELEKKIAQLEAQL